MFVDTCWGPCEINEKPYWHLVPTKGTNAMIFYNNVSVGKGALLTVSAGIKAEPNLANAHTPYSQSRINDEKEAAFESVRRNRYPALPSRLKTAYLFDDYNLVERALKEWFSNAPKIAHECRVLSGSIIHKADTSWLNCHQNEWEICADKYWSGIMSERPFPETIVDGAIYFPHHASFSILESSCPT